MIFMVIAFQPSVNCVIMELVFLDENNGALLGSTEYDLVDICIK